MSNRCLSRHFVQGSRSSRKHHDFSPYQEHFALRGSPLFARSPLLQDYWAWKLPWTSTSSRLALTAWRSAVPPWTTLAPWFCSIWERCQIPSTRYIWSSRPLAVSSSRTFYFPIVCRYMESFRRVGNQLTCCPAWYKREWRSPLTGCRPASISVCPFANPKPRRNLWWPWLPNCLPRLSCFAIWSISYD